MNKATPTLPPPPLLHGHDFLNMSVIATTCIKENYQIFPTFSTRLCEATSMRPSSDSPSICVVSVEVASHEHHTLTHIRTQVHTRQTADEQVGQHVAKQAGRLEKGRSYLFGLMLKEHRRCCWKGAHTLEHKHTQSDTQKTAGVSQSE